MNSFKPPYYKGLNMRIVFLATLLANLAIFNGCTASFQPFPPSVSKAELKQVVDSQNQNNQVLAKAVQDINQFLTAKFPPKPEDKK